MDLKTAFEAGEPLAFDEVEILYPNALYKLASKSSLVRGGIRFVSFVATSNKLVAKDSFTSEPKFYLWTGDDWSAEEPVQESEEFPVRGHDAGPPYWIDFDVYCDEAGEDLPELNTAADHPFGRESTVQNWDSIALAYGLTFQPVGCNGFPTVRGKLMKLADVESLAALYFESYVGSDAQISMVPDGKRGGTDVIYEIAQPGFTP